MNNWIINKTSSEEGKYAEYLVEHVSKKLGKSYDDRSDDTDYQKIDVDANIDDVLTEVKNDTIIYRTGNAVYEISTHASKEDERMFYAWKDRQSEPLRFRDIPPYGSIGCNEKCEADEFFYVSTIEDREGSKQYRLNFNDPAYIIDNKKFKAYVRNTPLKKWQVKIVPHEEDKAYNIILLIKINDLIKAGVAKRIDSETLSVLEESRKIFSTPMTSEELGRKLKIIE